MRMNQPTQHAFELSEQFLENLRIVSVPFSELHQVGRRSVAPAINANTKHRKICTRLPNAKSHEGDYCPSYYILSYSKPEGALEPWNGSYFYIISDKQLGLPTLSTL